MDQERIRRFLRITQFVTGILNFSLYESLELQKQLHLT